MFRFHAKLAASLAALVVATVLLAKAVGSLQPLHPALTGFIVRCQERPRPCWNGIILGETSPATAIYQVAGSHSYRPASQSPQTYRVEVIPLDKEDTRICTVRYWVEDSLLDAISLTVCDNAGLRIGDVAASLGEPYQVLNTGRIIFMYYGRTEILGPIPDPWSWFDPVTTVRFNRLWK